MNVAWLAVGFASISLCCLTPVFAAQEVHPAIERLGKEGTERWDDFEYPYSICQTIRRMDFPLLTLKQRLRAQMADAGLGVAAHFSSGKLPALTASSLVLPKELESAKEKEGLGKCSVKKCFQKLQNDLEKPTLIAASDKAQTYHRLLVSRVQNFLKDQALPGYDDRKDNRPALRSALELFSYFKSWYPQIFAYFHGTFWGKAPREKFITDSTLRARTMVLGENKILEPIYWISEVFRAEEGGNELYIEIPIYSNHYFDSWIRIYELMPVPKQPQESVLVLTDILEIDELKKSALIRMLYRGKMADAIFSAQKTEIAPLLVEHELKN